MIDAAIVGLGRWGRTLVEAVQRKSDKLRFTHAVSRDPERLRGIEAARGLTVVDDLAAVLADRAVDAVVIATPHTLHSGQIAAAAAAGKAVFCEKPLTLDTAEAERAIAACRAAGVVLGVGTDKRFFPAFAELARIVGSGALGRLLHVEANFSNEVAAQYLAPWRELPGESPAGGLTGTGVHVIDVMVHLFGPVRRVAASVLAHQPAPDPQDSLAALFEFECGITGLLAAVRSTPMFLRVHVFGRDGSAEALRRGELVLRKSGAAPERRTLPPVDSVRVNLEAFADAVAGRAPYPIPPEEILATVAASQAIIRAARPGGGWVEA
jgi:predicted dehydrogenase